LLGDNFSFSNNSEPCENSPQCSSAEFRNSIWLQAFKTVNYPESPLKTISESYQ
jgi:hypothetical protein